MLLLFSLIFYAFGEPVYLFLMIATLLFDWLFGLLIEKYRSKKSRKKAILTIAVIFNLSLLGFFKYYDFFAGFIPFLEPIGLSLPVGISFYTFQALSYVIDIYRGEAKAARSPWLPATYVTLFPQLIAGPIIKYNDIEDSLTDRRHSVSLSAYGIRRFTVGLAKKVLLANTAGELWECFCANYSLYGADTLGAWLGVIFFAFDFSGYSDMAIGLGKLFGFDFPENFNYPYISKSITEFWRRWHITLSSFFRDYVYIPLGGNRKSKARTYINLLTVWALTGLWHGAGVNFLIWGLYFFVILAIEKLFLLKLLKKLPSAVAHIYAIIAILFGWLIFASDGSPQSLSASLAFSVAKTMLGIGTPLASSLSLYELKRNLLPLIIMVAASLPIFAKLANKTAERVRLGSHFTVLQNTATAALFVLCVSYRVSSGYNPFLYFRV